MGESAIRVAAVDLGASSGRIVVGTGGATGFTLHEVHRFANHPAKVDGTLRWDATLLRSGVLEGLRRAVAEVGSLDAISVDGWAVDYGLLDLDGELIDNPVHYRDSRTAAPFEQLAHGAFAELDEARLYAATGIAPRAFNTVFQLLADAGTGRLESARHALLIPDLITYWLSGAMGTELTNASTTQLLDPRTMTWASDVVGALSIPIGLFPPLWHAGTTAGTVSESVASLLGVDPTTQLVVGPSHDTAAAVAGVPAEDESFAFVCTGTWALVGIELPAPIINDSSRAAGFSNEVGVDGTIRLLRNVTGFWLLQECVRDWQAAGRSIDLDQLTRAASQQPATAALIDVQDPAFTAPDGMVERILAACQRTSGVRLASDAAILRCILDSMAVAIRQAIREAMRVGGRDVRVIHVVGGGVANTLFCQLVADACDLPVVAGPTEAASWGNVLVQARALGVVSGSLAQLRSVIRQAVELTTYSPRGDETRWRQAEDVVLAARAAVES
jgi:rhamnulokinase